MGRNKAKTRLSRSGSRTNADSGPDLITPTWYFISVIGPLILLYVNLRCIKNLCILWYFPLTIPSRIEDYINWFSIIVVLGFVVSQMIWKRLFTRSVAQDGLPDEDEKIPTAFSSFIFFTAVLSVVYIIRPDFLMAVQKEHVAILFTTILSTIVYCLVISLISHYSFPLEQERGFFSLFFCGPNIEWPAFLSEWFFFIHIGLVGWGLLDLVFMLNAIGSSSSNISVVHIFVTQYFLISHSLMFEKFFQRRAFMRLEKLGYIWMAKFVILMPFLCSLPLLQVSVSDFAMHPSPVHLCNLVFFAFGFLIYAPANHQMDRFLKDRRMAKDMESVNITSPNGRVIKRLLVSGYWSCVRRPDYLGMAMMWMSWMIACGFSAVSLVLLVAALGLILISAQQADTFNETKYADGGFAEYSERVPRKLIPYVF